MSFDLLDGYLVKHIVAHLPPDEIVRFRLVNRAARGAADAVMDENAGWFAILQRRAAFRHATARLRPADVHSEYHLVLRPELNESFERAFRLRSPTLMRITAPDCGCAIPSQPFYETCDAEDDAMAQFFSEYFATHIMQGYLYNLLEEAIAYGNSRQTSRLDWLAAHFDGAEGGLRPYRLSEIILNSCAIRVAIDPGSPDGWNVLLWAIRRIPAGPKFNLDLSNALTRFSNFLIDHIRAPSVRDVPRWAVQARDELDWVASACDEAMADYLVLNYVLPASV